MAGWGLQLNDRTIFAWSGTDADHPAPIGLSSSAERALWMVELSAPARLVWMEPAEPST